MFFKRFDTQNNNGLQNKHEEREKKGNFHPKNQSKCKCGSASPKKATALRNAQPKNWRRRTECRLEKLGLIEWARINWFPGILISLGSQLSSYAVWKFDGSRKPTWTPRCSKFRNRTHYSLPNSEIDESVAKFLVRAHVRPLLKRPLSLARVGKNFFTRSIIYQKTTLHNSSAVNQTDLYISPKALFFSERA